MIDTLSMFATCVLPGCGNVVSETGDACGTCVAAFDWMLTGTPSRMTAEEIAERDNAVRAAYEQHQQQTVTRKPNQKCWMCEERRVCASTPQGWECRDCQEVEA